MKTINISELNKISMAANKNSPKKVIRDGRVFEYVGIGWINTREATENDLENIPTAID